MTTDRWRELSFLYQSVLARPADERHAYLQEACAGDESLQHEVEALLAADAEPALIDAPALEAAARALAADERSSLIGCRLAGYEIVSVVGIGGMGVVYRARDTKLRRDVALKVLPAAFTNDAARMARFQREAQLLASLNHSHIAAIYGLEESGKHRAIVMELVEGDTLRGPLPVAEALRLAKQIADAVEYAHDKSIIHRDLKPANIKVTPGGSVKVLDFGLAKALDAAGDADAPLHGSMSPTGLTHTGVILGTAAYMAPEQARGKAADRRADVWAFGVVLYELLTGERMFGGDTVAETLASVMKDQPAFEKLPADTPSAIRKLVARCLDRDVRRRLQSIGEARIVIEDAIAGGVQDDGGLPPQYSRSVSRALWAVSAVLLVALVAVGALAWAWYPRPSAPSARRRAFHDSSAGGREAQLPGFQCHPAGCVARRASPAPSSAMTPTAAALYG